MSGLRSAVEEHVTVDPTDIPTDDLSVMVTETAEVLDRLSVFLSQVTDEARRRQVHELEGFGSPTSWLAARADWDHATARRHVTAGHTLHHYPKTAARAREGSLSSARLRILARAASAFPDNYSADEDMLLSFSRDLGLSDLRRAVEHWGNVVEAVRAEDEAFDRTEAAYLHASPTLDGMVKVDGLLDKERGEVLLTALDTAMTPEARRDGSGGDLRPASRRRADALVDICGQFLDSYPGVIGGNKPHVSLIVDAPTLREGNGRICELTFTGTITPDTARRILCDAVVTPIICDTDGQPLWLGRSKRTATPAQRRALAVRDKGCVSEGCGRPPQWCDVHHTRGFTHWGGETDIDEMVLYCRRHHILAHRLEDAYHNEPHPTDGATDPCRFLTVAGRGSRGPP